MCQKPLYSGFGHRKTMKIAKFQGLKRKTNKEDIKKNEYQLPFSACKRRQLFSDYSIT
jgi:hypothetical protein